MAEQNPVAKATQLKASAQMPKREMANGVTAESLMGASRGNDGARLAVTRADAGALSGVSSGRVAAALRIGTAEGSGDGSSVRSDGTNNADAQCALIVIAQMCAKGGVR